MPAHESDAAQEIAHSWSRTLIGVRDPKLQVAWVRERLVQLGAARAADVLTIVLARAEQREERYAVLLLRASLALAAPELTGVKRAIACCAEARSQVGLARFLGARADQVGRSDSREDVLEGAPPVASAAPYEEPSERALAGVDPALRRALESSKGRPLSLGERKSLARRRDRNVLARALRDPHPDVVRILLDNPALIEIDVVRLCARRPVQPEVLALVFAHERWIVRYRIRLALVLNPHTPESIAVQLLPHLTPSDLRAVAQSGDISARVRDACAAPTERSIH
jgi:hypothetical protein